MQRKKRPLGANKTRTASEGLAALYTSNQRYLKVCALGLLLFFHEVLQCHRLRHRKHTHGKVKPEVTTTNEMTREMAATVQVEATKKRLDDTTLAESRRKNKGGDTSRLVEEVKGFDPEDLPQNQPRRNKE